MENILMKLYRITLFIILGMIYLSTNARAATYNFYFNNTEQGDNSTASPNLSVKDGKQEESAKSEVETGVPADSNENAQPTIEPIQSQPIQPEATAMRLMRDKWTRSMAEPVHFYDYYPFRFDLGAALVSMRRETSNFFINPRFDFGKVNMTPRKSKFGLIYAGVSYYVNDKASASLNLGSFQFLEVAWLPWNYSNARQKYYRKIEFGVLGGLSTTFKEKNGGVKPHIGARIMALLNREVSVYAGYRTSVFNSWGKTKNFNYSQIDAGLSFHP